MYFNSDLFVASIVLQMINIRFIYSDVVFPIHVSVDMTFEYCISRFLAVLIYGEF